MKGFTAEEPTADCNVWS